MKVKVDVEVLVGVGAVARVFAISRQTVENYLRDGRFPGAFQLPTGVWRIPMADIEALRKDDMAKKGEIRERKINLNDR